MAGDRMLRAEVVLACTDQMPHQPHLNTQTRTLNNRGKMWEALFRPRRRSGLGERARHVLQSFMFHPQMAKKVRLLALGWRLSHQIIPGF